MRHLSAWAAAFLFFAGFFLAFFDFWGVTPGSQISRKFTREGAAVPSKPRPGIRSPLGGAGRSAGGRGAGTAGGAARAARFFLRAGGAAAGLRGARRARGAAAASRRAKAGGVGRRRGKNGAAPVRAQGACGGRGRAGRAVARRRGGRGGAGAHGAKSAGRRRGAAGRAQGGQIRRARGARRRFFWRGADFWGRRAKKSPFLLYKEAGFFARFSLSDQS